jgi:NADPH:quinone reductase
VEAAAAASINPMTALAMLETMRGEGHSALCLTAAASNLGRMVNRLCLRDGVPLVNIVRSPQQVALLRGLGAECVLDSTEAHFDEALEAAMAATGATIAFDATGGGTLGGRILRAMDRSLAARAPGQGRYGSAVHKQLYFFGGLNPEPVTFQRDFGMAWGMGGWLLQARLARLDPAQLLAMKQRVRDELSGTFSSSFGGSIGLGEMIVEDHVRRYANRGTGDKLLVRP